MQYFSFKCKPKLHNKLTNHILGIDNNASFKYCLLNLLMSKAYYKITHMKDNNDIL